MSYLDWHVGMKVVCVESAPSPGDTRCLQTGQIYTIRGITHWTHWEVGEPEIGVWLDEVVRPRHEGIEHPLAARRFRPVQTRKTDISVFTAMLKPSKVDA